MKHDTNASEIVSLNTELISFDIGDISVDELERRLELAIATITPVLDDCGTNCGTFCSPFSCNTNCGAHFGKLGC